MEILKAKDREERKEKEKVRRTRRKRVKRVENGSKTSAMPVDELVALDLAVNGGVKDKVSDGSNDL
jgi:hypothetical protein